MILNESQKVNIGQLKDGEMYTVGGVAVGQEKRYEVHRVTDREYKVAVFALMICLDVDYVASLEEVIDFIEHN